MPEICNCARSHKLGSNCQVSYSLCQVQISFGLESLFLRLRERSYFAGANRAPNWLARPFLIEQGNHFLNLTLSFIHHWCENLLTAFCQQDSRRTFYSLSRSGWTTVLSWGPSCQFKCFLHWSTPRITSIDSFSCPFSVHFRGKFNFLVRTFWFPFSALENSLMNTV